MTTGKPARSSKEATPCAGHTIDGMEPSGDRAPFGGEYDKAVPKINETYSGKELRQREPDNKRSERRSSSASPK